jgi:xanthine dehydrogenase YagR molybdenum-binding subunit
VEVHSGGADIGTGTYTILAQAAAEVLGVPVANVSVSLGDTVLPRAPVAGRRRSSRTMLMGAVAKARGRDRAELLNVGGQRPEVAAARRSPRQ